MLDRCVLCAEDEQKQLDLMDPALAGVVGAAIGATAGVAGTLITTLAQARNQKEKWSLGQAEARRQWLLDRRAEACSKLLDWRFRDADDPLVEQERSTIYVPVWMCGSKSVRDTVSRYDRERSDEPWASNEPDP